MKTAISVPDDVFELAERKARQLHMTRSQLYVNAVRDYLRKEIEDDLTARVNATAEDERGIDEGLVGAQVRAAADEWTW
jgi:hypothetical protein